MLRFVKKHFILIPLIFLFPLVLVVVYLFLVDHSDANNYVPVISGLLTYYGSSSIAITALFLNEKADERDQRAADIEEIRLRNTVHPSIYIDDILNSDEEAIRYRKIYKSGWGDIYQCEEDVSETMYVVIKNTGNASAYNVQVYEYDYSDAITDFVKYATFGDYKPQTITEIKQDESKCLEYHLHSGFVFSITFNICYQNEYGSKYYNSVFISLFEFQGKPCFQVGMKEQQIGEADLNVRESFEGQTSPSKQQAD